MFSALVTASHPLFSLETLEAGKTYKKLSMVKVCNMTPTLALVSSSDMLD